MLDPIWVKNITQTINNQLIKLDPINIDYYKQNTNNFIKVLDLLDKHIRKWLIKCKLHGFITFHESFHYFANRYGLTQHAVHQSLSSDGDPSTTNHKHLSLWLKALVLILFILKN